MQIEDVIKLLQQWKASQEERMHGLDSNRLTPLQRAYHAGCRDAYGAILGKILGEEEVEK